MLIRQWLRVAAPSASAAVLAAAQQPKTFKARLSPVPIDVTMQATIAGIGIGHRRCSTGTKLAVTGTFEGLQVAGDDRAGSQEPGAGRSRTGRLRPDGRRRPTARAARSAARSTSPPLQVADLEKGRLYVQLHSEKAPDGNLWGWLLPQENRR